MSNTNNAAKAAPVTPAKPAPQAAAPVTPPASTPPQAAAPVTPPAPTPNLPVGAAPTAGGKTKLGPRPSATLVRSYDWALTTINLVVAANPKRGASATRYGLYRHGMTIAALVQANKAAEGKRASAVTVDDLTWDLQHGFVTLNVVMPVAPAPVAPAAENKAA